MNYYTIILQTDDKFVYMFECLADNVFHAEEQCADAYPSDNILYTIRHKAPPFQ